MIRAQTRDSDCIRSRPICERELTIFNTQRRVIFYEQEYRDQNFGTTTTFEWREYFSRAETANPAAAPTADQEIRYGFGKEGG